MARLQPVLRSLLQADLPDVGELLTAEGFGKDSGDRLRASFDQIRTFSFVAVRANCIEGVLLATFNGWHVFASHLAVAPSARGGALVGL
jgi:hypothetical protein